MWTALAHGMVVVHVAYLLYVPFGGLLALRNPGWLVPHIGCVIWSVVVVVADWSCPLTELEKWLWVQSGEGAYSGSFLRQYIFGPVLPVQAQAALYALELAVVAGVYIVVVKRHVLLGARHHAAR